VLVNLVNPDNQVNSENNLHMFVPYQATTESIAHKNVELLHDDGGGIMGGQIWYW